MTDTMKRDTEAVIKQLEEVAAHATLMRDSVDGLAHSLLLEMLAAVSVSQAEWLRRFGGGLADGDPAPEVRVRDLDLVAVCEMARMWVNDCEVRGDLRSEREAIDRVDAVGDALMTHGVVTVVRE